jgi:hypothetical protein
MLSPADGRRLAQGGLKIQVDSDARPCYKEITMTKMMRVAKVTFSGLDPIYRRSQRRWHCSACGAQGWDSSNTMAPADHDRPDGRVCKVG